MKITRRQILSAAGVAPVLLPPADAAAEQVEAPGVEVLEYVQKMMSFESTSRGVTLHCATSRGKAVDVELTICAPEILRFQLCPDSELSKVKGLTKDTPNRRPIERKPTSDASLISLPRLGGLHHRYTWRQAA
jgi:hypothetical protein